MTAALTLLRFFFILNIIFMYLFVFGNRVWGIHCVKTVGTKRQWRTMFMERPHLKYSGKETCLFAIIFALCEMCLVKTLDTAYQFTYFFMSIALYPCKAFLCNISVEISIYYMVFSFSYRCLYKYEQLHQNRRAKPRFFLQAMSSG